MTYPQAPWTLQGFTLVTLQPIDIAQVRSLVPPELEIISVWPGKTVGGVYVASYSSSSVLAYNELIVVAALTRYAGRFGTWISHIYVDNPDSVAGGREIWGLPKELAQFTWEQGRSCVHIHQGDQLLCNLKLEWRLPGWQQQLTGYSFSALNTDLLFFRAQGELHLSLSGAKLQIPAKSPFSEVGLSQPWLSFYGDRLHLNVATPEAVGEIASPLSYSLD